jgi:hypothetical protein
MRPPRLADPPRLLEGRVKASVSGATVSSRDDARMIRTIGTIGHCARSMTAARGVSAVPSTSPYG